MGLIYKCDGCGATTEDSAKDWYDIEIQGRTTLGGLGDKLHTYIICDKCISIDKDKPSLMDILKVLDNPHP